jgi:hypothetical protein
MTSNIPEKSIEKAEEDMFATRIIKNGWLWEVGKRLKEWGNKSIDFIDLVSLRYVMIAKSKRSKNRIGYS